MLAKASGLAADEIVIDLEDAVAATAKDEARALVVEALSAGAMQGRNVAVRINGLDSPWCHRDIVALADGPAAAALHTLIIPKVQAPDDVDWVERLLDMIGAGAAEIGVQALIETAEGLRCAGEIAHAGTRLEALILGYADLRASLGRPANPGESAESWSFAQESVLVAAKAAGLQAIDGPHLRVDDPDGLRAWAAHVRALGFDGKWAIHPSQLETLNGTFAPTAAEIERAHGIVAALQDAEAGAGRGAVTLNGEMIDEALRKQAFEVMARAQAAGLAAASAPEPAR